MVIADILARSWASLPCLCAPHRQTVGMRFRAEHRFDGSADAVAALLVDADFYQGLDLPDLSRPEVLQSGSDGEHPLLRLRYEFVGRLDPFARRLLGGHRLAWIQVVRLEPSARSGELTFTAAADPKRLHGSAQFTLEEEDGRCARRLSGEVVVAVPLIGPPAERKIVPGVLRRLDIEAEAVNARLTDGLR